MIWCCDHAGVCNYVGPEWEHYTGQPGAHALGAGWAAMVHDEDRDEVVRTKLDACAAASTFTMQYRLRRKEGGFGLVVSSAAPSHSPVDGSFTGFLGAITEVSKVCRELAPHRSLGYLKLPSRVGAMVPDNKLDRLTDYVLMAREAAERAGDKTLIASLDVTLSLIFLKLGGSRSHN